tara:strand:- start:34 stop:420 length:387 start_codon:yes stop_codon:yes gene_type:complete
MLRALVISVITIGLFTGCTPKLVITNQDTGISEYGTASGANFSSTGNVKINIDGEEFTGPWIAMRDPGNAALTFWSMGPKDSGVGIANLTSPSGKFVRCEFGYNMTSLSGLGLCKDKQGATYDFMMSM